MASKISQLNDLLQGSHVMDNGPLVAYHAAKACLNANRKVGTERRFQAIRKAVKNFRVMVSIMEDSAIRIHRPDVRGDFILTV